jgi:hypothetical protein
VIPQPHAASAAPIQAEQIGRHAGLVHEDVAGGVVERQRLPPAATRRGDIGPTLFIGVNGFFLA